MGSNDHMTMQEQGLDSPEMTKAEVFFRDMAITYAKTNCRILGDRTVRRNTTTSWEEAIFEAEFIIDNLSEYKNRTRMFARFRCSSCLSDFTTHNCQERMKVCPYCGVRAPYRVRVYP